MPRSAHATELPPSPTSKDIRRIERLMGPWEMLTSPKYFGWENVPDERPLLFVGNHSLFGVLDSPLFWLELYRQTGILARPLGDRLHFVLPVWREVPRMFGVVEGSPANFTRLMEQGEVVAVYPGGSREGGKQTGEKYRLLWGNRMGFARSAIAHGCTIVPFAMVGGDDTFDILISSQAILNSPIGSLLRTLGFRSDIVPPIVKGMGPTLIPRPVRLYFKILPPVPTREFQGREEEPEIVKAVRDQVKHSVEEGLQWLLDYRHQDPKRHLLPRMQRKLLKNLAEKFGKKKVTS